VKKGVRSLIKPKIYLDTSVISHLLTDDLLERRNDTHLLWKQLGRKEYEVIVSPVVYEELSRCTDDLKEQLFVYLSAIETTFVEENEEMTMLAEEYLKTGVLKEKSFNDCRHIAIASIHCCKYILSWNMKHFVKRRTIEMVQDVNGRLGIPQPNILTPSMFIEGDDESG